MPRRRKSLIAPGILALITIAGALTFALPLVMLRRATTASIACFEGFTEARGPKAPDCRPIIAQYVTPSKVPWTATDASYRAEELYARQAYEDYRDALVGHPSREARQKAQEGLEEQERALAAQSQRILLQDLGPTIGAPNVGHLADDLGDRAALLAREHLWLPWPVRMRTLEAELLEGRVDEALEVANHYASYDPRDEDLRMIVASFLCLGGQTQRGVNFLKLVQDDRAKDRHENFVRGWGDARWLMIACARAGNLTPAAKPERADAGRLDRDEARAVIRLRVTRDHAKDDPVGLFDSARATMELLREARANGTRLPLLLALLASGYAPLEASDVADFATPRVDEGEASALDQRPPTALDWLDEPRGVVPFLMPEDAAKAAGRLDELTRAPGISKEIAQTLAQARHAAWLEQARLSALAGDTSGALTAIDKSRDDQHEGEDALARSSALWLGEKPADALAALEKAAIPASPVAATGQALQLAELYALTPARRAEASKVAIDAHAKAAPTHDAGLVRRAAWARLAFAEGSPIDDAERALAQTLTERRSRYFPWETPSDGAPKELVPVSSARLALALVRWDEARRAAPEEQRALRYAVLGHRADVPTEYLASLSILTQLLREGEGDTELWLDTATVHDTRRMTLRRYVWCRAQAALARGDAKVGAAWLARYGKLRALATDSKRGELARYIGL